MQKNSNRKGLALGAVFALVASLFATAPAAQANVDGANIGAYPALGTTFTGVITEDFPVFVQLLPGSASYTNAAFASDLNFIVEKTAGTNMDVVVSASGTVTNMQNVTFSTPVETASVSKKIQAGSTSATVSPLVVNGVAHLNFRASTASAHASASAVTLRVTAFLDTQGGSKNDTVDSNEWRTTFTVTLVRPESLNPGITLTQPNAGDRVVTVSSTITGANLANLGGSFHFAMSSSGAIYTGTPSTSTVVGTAETGATLALRSGVLSQSFVVEPGSMSANVSVSAAVRYFAPGGSAGMYTGQLLGSVSTLGVASVAASALTLTLVDSANALSTSKHVRANNMFTVRVHAASAGVSASGVAVTIKFAGSEGLATGSKTVSINGGPELTNYPESVTLTTGTDGFASWTMKTSGFADGNAINIQANVGNTTATLTNIVQKLPVFSITNDFTHYATTPGAAVNVTYTVKDQFGELSARTDQRIQVTRVATTGFSYVETVSNVAVVAGKATFAFNPTPATATGSPQLSTSLQRFDSGLNAWVADTGGVAAGNVTVRVSGVVSTFSAVSVASQSASISYFPNTVSYKTVTATVTGAGESVRVSGPAALIFREGGFTATSSGAITLRSNASGVVTLNVAALLEGTHTITFTVGAVSTTSLLIVDAAAGSAGTRITFDKSSIASGETSTITGKIVDANGNPVNTTNTDGAAAVVVVSYTGKGLPFNTGSTIETDEKGEFKVNILALPGDVGTGTLTATYRPTNEAVNTRNVTATQVITIAAPAAVAAPEVNAVIGTFNGRWAVRVENAKGAVVSVKVGNRWVKYTSLNDNYLFSRKSRVGATLPVAVYVNGQLENVATITIK